MLVTKLSQFSDFDMKNPQTWVKNVNTDLNNLFLCDQGQIRFGTVGSTGMISSAENMSGQFYTYKTNATANTSDTINHTLGSTPQGYIVIRNNAAGIIYDAGTTWTPNQIFLKCSTSAMLTTIFIIK